MPTPRHEIAAAAIAGFFVLLLLPAPASAIRSVPLFSGDGAAYAEAPHFRNSDLCPNPRSTSRCDPAFMHIAMTLDASYLRGSIAAVHSILKHAACPDLVFFHFVVSCDDESLSPRLTLLAAFPSLKFKIYPFVPAKVASLISPSIRPALENPLNYARNYLADLIDPCISRVIYLDSDVVVVDDIRRLWEAPMANAAVIAAPEYCHANFTRYFKPSFWEDKGEWGASVFEGRTRRPCYFNTGVMVMDLRRWREGGYTKKIEGWMRQQRERGIYELGSLPPFLLVFAGDVEAVEHRWNVHGLGGDNVSGSCRPLHPGPVSLLHWSGRGKPWDRLDAGRPCSVDHLWAPYDLYLHPASTSIGTW